MPKPQPQAQAADKPRTRATRLVAWACAAVLACVAAGGCAAVLDPGPFVVGGDIPAARVTADTVPTYRGEPYVQINDNVPGFTAYDATTEPFELYSGFDQLDRCGGAFLCIGAELLPLDEREGIGSVKPSGWQTVKYDFVEGKYLYNRCHLAAYMLSGENTNKLNLITGTRYLNTTGMAPFEDLVYDYVLSTQNHVLYRVTPVFEGDNLVASGVQIEACSVEDVGAGVCFNVFVFNVQPGVHIDYATGESRLADDWEDQLERAGIDYSAPVDQDSRAAQEVAPHNKEDVTVPAGTSYVLNTNTLKFHDPNCSSVTDLSAKNRAFFTGTRAEALAQGYEPCGICNP